jgi:hypothetical protein
MIKFSSNRCHLPNPEADHWQASRHWELKRRGFTIDRDKNRPLASHIAVAERDFLSNSGFDGFKLLLRFLAKVDFFELLFHGKHSFGWSLPIPFETFGQSVNFKPGER